MVNLLRSSRLVELNTVIIDVGLTEQTALNSWLCFDCWLYYADNMIDSVTGLCLHCCRVTDGEGEEGGNELSEMD